MKTMDTGKGLQNELHNYQIMKTNLFSYYLSTLVCEGLSDNIQS